MTPVRSSCVVESGAITMSSWSWMPFVPFETSTPTTVKPIPFTLIVWPSGFAFPNRFETTVGAEHDDARVLRLLLRRDERARLHRRLARLLVGGRRADELRRASSVAEPNVVVTELAFTTGVTDFTSGAAFRSWSAFTSFSVSCVNELLAAAGAAAAAEAAGHDRDDVRAETLDLLLDGDARSRCRRRRG